MEQQSMKVKINLPKRKRRIGDAEDASYCFLLNLTRDCMIISQKQEDKNLAKMCLKITKHFIQSSQYIKSRNELTFDDIMGHLKAEASEQIEIEVFFGK